MSQNQTHKYSRSKQKQNKRWLPVVLALGGLLLVGLAFLALREKPTPSASIEIAGLPSLKVDQDKIDLGNMKFNQPARVSFQLTNVGDQTLRFTKAPYIEVVEGC